MSKSPSVDQLQDPLAGAWRTMRQSGAVKVLLGIAVVVSGFQAFATLTDRHEQQDFAHYYASSQLWLEGASTYTADLSQRYQELGWEAHDEPIFQATNPPGLVALFSPFAKLEPQVAHTAWLLLQLLSLVVACWLTWQCVKERISFDGFCLVLAVFLLLPFVRIHLFYSQVQLLLLAMTLAAYRLILSAKAKPGEDIRIVQIAGVLSCVIVALAAAIKVFPLVLLPWFVWRSQKSIAGRVTSGFAAIAAIGVVVWATGLNNWIDFYHHALPVIKTWMKAGYECFTLANASHQFGAMLTGDIESEMWLRLGSLLGLLLLVLFFAQLVFRPLVCEKSSLNVEFALLILLMLFCGGTCWWHYLVFLIFPMQVIATQIGTRITIPVLALSALAILLFANIGIPVANIEFLKPLTNQRPLWGMVLMAGFLAGRLKSNPPGGLAKR